MYSIVCFFSLVLLTVSVKLDTFVDIFLDSMHSECTKNPGKETVCSDLFAVQKWEQFVFSQGRGAKQAP